MAFSNDESRESSSIWRYRWEGDSTIIKECTVAIVLSKSDRDPFKVRLIDGSSCRMLRKLSIWATLAEAILADETSRASEVTS